VAPVVALSVGPSARMVGRVAPMTPKLRRRISIRPQNHTERALDALILFLATVGLVTWIGTLHPGAAFGLGFGWAVVIGFWVRDWR
jgi:hypothetical protein